VLKRCLSPSDTKYKQAFSPVLQLAFNVPSSAPEWEADLLAKLDRIHVRSDEDLPVAQTLTASSKQGLATTELTSANKSKP
jgi:hypothetical protein